MHFALTLLFGHDAIIKLHELYHRSHSLCCSTQHHYCAHLKYFLGQPQSNTTHQFLKIVIFGCDYKRNKHDRAKIQAIQSNKFDTPENLQYIEYSGKMDSIENLTKDSFLLVGQRERNKKFLICKVRWQKRYLENRSQHLWQRTQKQIEQYHKKLNFGFSPW